MNACGVIPPKMIKNNKHFPRNLNFNSEIPYQLCSQQAS